MKEHGEPTAVAMKAAFDKVIPLALQVLVTAKISTFVPVSPTAMVVTMCHLLEGLLSSMAPAQRGSHPHMLHLVLFAAAWAFGGPAADDNGTSAEGEEEAGRAQDSRAAFSEAWRQAFAKYVAYPEAGHVLDYFAHIGGPQPR